MFSPLSTSFLPYSERAREIERRKRARGERGRLPSTSVVPNGETDGSRDSVTRASPDDPKAIKEVANELGPALQTM